MCCPFFGHSSIKAETPESDMDKNSKIPPNNHIPAPTAIVCANGDIPPKSFFQSFETLPLIATDGAGLQLIHQYQILPSVVIGDFDSSDPEQYPVPTIRDPSQEEPDFEKALRYALSQGHYSLLIVGIHGQDFDHTLNNWSVYIRYAQRHPLWIYDHHQIAIGITRSVTFPARPGERISLIPQPEALLTTQGLQWELRQEWLRLGEREGARNRAVAPQIAIYLHAGSYLLFLPAYLPAFPKISYIGNMETQQTGDVSRAT